MLDLSWYSMWQSSHQWRYQGNEPPKPVMLVPRDGFEHLLVEWRIEEREMLHVGSGFFNLQALHTCTCQMNQLPEMLPGCMHKVKVEVL